MKYRKILEYCLFVLMIVGFMLVTDIVKHQSSFLIFWQRFYVNSTLYPRDDGLNDVLLPLPSMSVILFLVLKSAQPLNFFESTWLNFLHIRHSLRRHSNAYIRKRYISELQKNTFILLMMLGVGSYIAMMLLGFDMSNSMFLFYLGALVLYGINIRSFGYIILSIVHLTQGIFKKEGTLFNIILFVFCFTVADMFMTRLHLFYMEEEFIVNTIQSIIFLIIAVSCEQVVLYGVQRYRGGKND